MSFTQEFSFRRGERSLPKPSPSLGVFPQVLKSVVYLYSRLVILRLQVGGEHMRELSRRTCECVFFFGCAGVRCLGSGQALGRQQRGFEGAGSGALTGGEHLAGEMVKGVMSFWGGTSPSVRTCTDSTHKLLIYLHVYVFLFFFT